MKEKIVYIFSRKIVILWGSEIVNREVEKCKSVTGKIFSSFNFSVSVISTNQE